MSRCLLFPYTSLHGGKKRLRLVIDDFGMLLRDPNKGEHAVRLLIAPLFINESGEPSKVTPVSGSGVAAEALSQRPRGCGRCLLVQNPPMVQPRLEIAWGGLDDQSWFEPAVLHLVNGFSRKVIYEAEVMFAVRPDVDCRAARVLRP